MKRVFLVIAVTLCIGVNASNGKLEIVNTISSKDFSKIYFNRAPYCERTSTALGGGDWDVIDRLYLSCMAK